MSWQHRLLQELDQAREYKRAGDELRTAFDQLRLGKFASQLRQKEKYKQLLTPLNELVVHRHQQQPHPSFNPESYATSTPYVSKKMAIKLDTNEDYNNDDNNEHRSAYYTPIVHQNPQEHQISDTSFVPVNMEGDGDEENDELLEVTLGPSFVHYMEDVARRPAKEIPEFNTDYGIYFRKDKPYIGDVPITVDKEVLWLPDGSNYPTTPGLWELMMMKKPTKFTQEDLVMYNDIQRTTSVLNGWESNAGYKYVTDIADNTKLTKRRKGNNKEQPRSTGVLTRSRAKQFEGSGLYKTITGAPVEYIYWDSIIELLDRLYILYGELKAGNTNPNIRNEIVNIVQEFQEMR